MLRNFLKNTAPPRLKIFKVFVAVAYLGNEAGEPTEKSADPTSLLPLHQSSSFDLDLILVQPAFDPNIAIKIEILITVCGPRSGNNSCSGPAPALDNLIYYPPPACLLLWLGMIDVHPDN